MRLLFCDICKARMTEYERRWVVVGDAGKGAPHKEERAGELCADCVAPALAVIAAANKKVVTEEAA